ncbi:MAG: hypothetical protein MUD17_11605, partial [Gemmatimonadaceae bacterium]|nr:hypothetical protein [Gemmatimonadaceae bacterium]
MSVRRRARVRPLGVAASHIAESGVAARVVLRVERPCVALVLVSPHEGSAARGADSCRSHHVAPLFSAPRDTTSFRLAKRPAQSRPVPTSDSTRRGGVTRPDSARPILPVVTITGARMRAAPPPVAMIAADTTALIAVPAATAYDLVRRVTGLEVHEQGQG